jgi:hypothetical protein
MIRIFLVIQMTHARDKRRVTLCFRPVYGFLLCPETGKLMVGMILDTQSWIGDSSGRPFGRGQEQSRCSLEQYRHLSETGHSDAALQVERYSRSTGLRDSHTFTNFTSAPVCGKNYCTRAVVADGAAFLVT